MLNKPMLQAHRGVSTDCPENTMSAFNAAIMQGYDVIELDPFYTSDNALVVLHDATLNRTARNIDGSPLSREVRIYEISYEKALEYDYGTGFSKRFAGERLPLLEDALELAAKNGVTVKIDNRLDSFPEEIKGLVYELIEKYEPRLALTTANPETLKFYAKRFPLAQLHYDGAVDTAVLKELSAYDKRVTVWVPYYSPLTSWASVSFADEKLCSEIKKYARLGIWIINDYESYEEVCRRFEPDIIETTGAIKPEINQGAIYDLHVHSQNSHDSVCPVVKAADAALEKGIGGFAVTDHCDIQYYTERDMPSCIANSVKEADAAAKEYDGKVQILKGVEIGEGIWCGEYADNIINSHNFDVVIGSVHAVRYKDLTIPFSAIDFSTLSDTDIDGYLDKYFDEVLETVEKIPCDVLAHLTCPLRYITGKYERKVDLKKYEEKITKILDYIIKNHIALEINTSGMGTAYPTLMPDKWIIKKYKEMGGYLVTLGSDAHTAKKLANGFAEAIEVLKTLGWRHYYYYKERKNIQCKI